MTPEVLFSKDGGKTWNPAGREDPGGYRLNAIFGTAAGEMYAVGDQNGETARIYRSTDRGRKWQEDSAGALPPLQAVWGDATGGGIMAAGNGGTLLRRTEGTWVPLQSGTDRDLFGIAGDGAGNLVVVGSRVILRSADGGKTWAKQDTDAVLFGALACGSGDLYAVGWRQEGPAGVILHSTNGGRTWAEKQVGQSGLMAVWGSTPQDVFAVGEQGTVLHSTDGGQTWARKQCGTTEYLRAIWGRGRQVLVASVEGSVLQSTDGGESFTTLYRDEYYDRAGIWGGPDGEILVVGSRRGPKGHLNIN